MTEFKKLHNLESLIFQTPTFTISRDEKLRSCSDIVGELSVIAHGPLGDDDDPEDDQYDPVVVGVLEAYHMPYGHDPNDFYSAVADSSAS